MACFFIMIVSNQDMELNSVEAIRAEQGVLVAIPLSRRDATHDTYLNTLIKSFTQHNVNGAPRCTHWDAKVRAATLRPEGLAVLSLWQN